jgi:hypothetical protein
MDGTWPGTKLRILTPKLVALGNPLGAVISVYVLASVPETVVRRLGLTL